MLFRSLVLATTLLATPAVAGDLTPKAAGEVLDQLDKGLGSYIFPDVARQAQASLKAHRAEFLKLDTREAFAAAVSKDLYATTRDKHLKVGVDTLDAGREARLTEEQQTLVDRRLAYGLSAVRRLPANIANWEGVGVVPDVATPPDQALTTAYSMALKAARPLVATPKSEKERADALADPRAALLADQAL